MADPVPIVRTFMTNPELTARLRLDGVITVADAKHIVGRLDDKAPPAGRGPDHRSHHRGVCAAVCRDYQGLSGGIRLQPYQSLSCSRAGLGCCASIGCACAWLIVGTFSKVDEGDREPGREVRSERRPRLSWGGLLWWGGQKPSRTVVRSGPVLATTDDPSFNGPLGDPSPHQAEPKSGRLLPDSAEFGPDSGSSRLRPSESLANLGPISGEIAPKHQPNPDVARLWFGTDQIWADVAPNLAQRRRTRRQRSRRGRSTRPTSRSPSATRSC